METKYYEEIQNLTLMDDIFMTKVLEDKKCTQEVLKLILDKDDIKIKEVNTQKELKSLTSRSIILDVYAEDNKGKKYNIEIQNISDGANPKRARYHSAMMDTDTLEKGENFEDLKETYVIFITAKDILGAKLSLYHIDRVIREMKKPFNDGANIIYFNTSIKNDTEIGKLASDFTEKEPDKINNKYIREKVKDYKEKEGGKKIMAGVMERLIYKERQEGIQEGRQEGRQETVIETAKKMLDEKLPIELISKITTLSIEDVKKLKETL